MDAAGTRSQSWWEGPGGWIVASYSPSGLVSLRPWTPEPPPGEPADLPDWLSELPARLERYWSGEPTSLDFPMDLSDRTGFTQKVYRWVAGNVGWGTTTTYGHVARMIGRPGAARAVGRAMATNRITLVMPCHRIISSSGALCGFSAPGGLDTKRGLLELEASG